MKVATANLRATAGLSAALVLLAFCSWQTSESTALIERAKAQPHFRIDQKAYEVSNGFLPQSFKVTPVAGVADATSAVAAEVFLIHYSSKSLNLSGICRASSTTMFGWVDDSMSFSVSDPGDRLLNLARSWGEHDRDASFSIQPLWTIVRVSFFDMFGREQVQALLVNQGQSSRLSPGWYPNYAWTRLKLNMQTNKSGEVVLYRMDDGKLDQGCVNALRVLSQIGGMRVGRGYLVAPDKSFVVAKDGAWFEPGDPAITTSDPLPIYLPAPNAKYQGPTTRSSAGLKLALPYHPGNAELGEEVL